MLQHLAVLAALPSVLNAESLFDGYSQAWMGMPGSIYQPFGQWGGSQAASWPPTPDLGKRIVPQAPNKEIREMLAEIDEDRIKHTISSLVDFGTRHTLATFNSSTRGINAARDWLYREMQEIAEPSEGRMEVYINSYIQEAEGRITFPVNISNVVAEVRGSVDPDRVYVVTGHYDSRRIDILDYEGDSPGANDDASGVAVVMEMARVCAKKKPAASMIFAAVSGEEQGLFGSAHLARTLKERGLFVAGNWNNDIVGTGKSEPSQPINDYTVRVFGASAFLPNASTATQLNTVAQGGGWNDSPAHNLGRYIAEVVAGASRYTGMQIALMYKPDRFRRGGDHQSFLREGFPAIRFTETVENYLHQHQDPREEDGVVYGDLLEFVDFDYVSRVTKCNLASMWAAANSPAAPANVTINRVIGLPAASQDTPVEYVNNDSWITWNTGNDTMVEGYELVWRPTTNVQWTHALDVGTSGNLTVAMNKDNVVMGIRAVGKNGWKSPAVWAQPA